MSKERIAVVGVGTIGAQALWHLSKSNADVVGFEIFSPGHPHGAAGGENRLFRRIELEDLRYQPIVDQADYLWRQLESESGEQLRDLSGALVFGEPGTVGMDCALKSAELCGDDARVFSHEEAKKLFGAYNIKNEEVAILEKSGGIIFPEKAIRAACTVAKANGVEIRTNARVERVGSRGNRVEIATDKGIELFDKVIVAAGAWTASLLPEVADYFAPRRLLSAWFASTGESSMSALLPYIRTEPNYSYGLPAPDGRTMKLGLGFPNHLPVEDPDTADLRISEEALNPLRELARSFIPQLNDYPTRVNPYFEAYTRSRVEFLRPHPENQNILIMGGFSGKGFKSSPYIGEIGARWALDQEQRNASQFILEHEQYRFDDLARMA